MAGLGAADIVSIGVLEDDVVLVHVIHRDVVARSAHPVTAQSQFDIIDFF